MAAKPWATSHVAAVASTYTDLRISGEVKGRLVELLVAKVDEVVPRMEDETLSQDPSRKTLDDPQRTRLGFNRTKGLMVERLESVESVSAAAVSAACEELENYLRSILAACEVVCTNNRMGTIKPRHLEEALDNLGVVPEAGSTQPSSAPEIEEDPLEEFATSGGGIITAAGLRQMARSFGGMKVDADALEELILLYYDEAGDLQHNLKTSLSSGDPAAAADSLRRLDDLAKMGFLRRCLKEAGELAQKQGSRTITIEHVLSLDV